MIDLDWIIEEENKLTDKASSDLGDNYYLTVNLLKLLQSIKGYSVENEIAHVFNTQILKGFHLTALNIIRRHSVEAHLILRYTLESIVLFVYSMENTKETAYGIIRNENQIIDFDQNVQEKAYKHIENKYQEFSKDIQSIKDFINSFYSHGNPLASQYNSAIIDGKFTALIFDSYFDDAIREELLYLNKIMCITLTLYKTLKKDYQDMFYLEDKFDKELEEIINRQEKHFNDFKEKYSGKGFWKDSKLMDKVLNKIEKNG